MDGDPNIFSWKIAKGMTSILYPADMVQIFTDHSFQMEFGQIKLKKSWNLSVI